MENDTKKAVELVVASEVGRAHGRPKGSKNRIAANAGAASNAAKHTAESSRLVAMNSDPSQLALDELRGSMDVGFEVLHEQLDKLQEAIRVLNTATGERPIEPPVAAELMTELKRVAATQQWKGEHVEQWTRVLVTLSGADRRRYWRIMRAVYGTANIEQATLAAGKGAVERGVRWWQVGLLAVAVGFALYVAMSFGLQ